MKNKHLPFWFLTFSFFSITTLPSLLSDGMFMDGLLYATIARNLSEGIGSFWNLSLTNTLYSAFREQPPLVFGIQSLFFKIFGDYLLVERLYSLSTAIVGGILIVSIWKKILKSPEELPKLAWLPLLFWVMIPLTFWCSANNMLENTLSIFTTGAVFMIISGMNPGRYSFLLISLSGIMITGAFLSKGLIGLFPLSAIAIYWFVFRKPSLKLIFRLYFIQISI
ncbi:glycosyltransferase family 39 protein, partial [Bacteroidales bacterium AH-315-N07]|nr:glycosyltransferase family 39 protein [Bacteroidales bacterium AH-315-N07]